MNIRIHKSHKIYRIENIKYHIYFLTHYSLLKLCQFFQSFIHKVIKLTVYIYFTLQ